MARIINKFGELIGWNNITLNLLERDIEGITELEYNDTVAIEAAYGAGRMPVGYTSGNYEASAKISLYKEEVIALEQSLPPGMRLQDIPPFDIIVKYEANGKIYKDIIHNCKFKNNGTASKQNEGKIEISFDLFTTHITWNAK